MRRQHRWAMTGGAMLLAVALTTACSPEPAPTPTPTGFASEEEAFAAAEATYRAYVDALNEVDLSDPATFEAVYAYTTGDARDSIAKELSQMHADGWRVDGDTTIAAMALQSWEHATVELNACADVSAVQLEDSTGQSMVGADRPPIQSVRVLVEKSKERTTVASITGRSGEPQC